jgi:hypothetical protein
MIGLVGKGGLSHVQIDALDNNPFGSGQCRECLRLFYANTGVAASCTKDYRKVRNPACDRLFESFWRLPALAMEVGLDIGPFGGKQAARRDVCDREGGRGVPSCSAANKGLDDAAGTA